MRRMSRGEAVGNYPRRIDGSGYPKELMGENILLEARILGVADVVEAMSHRRSHRSALGIDKALGEISRMVVSFMSLSR